MQESWASSSSSSSTISLRSLTLWPGWTERHTGTSAVRSATFQSVGVVSIVGPGTGLGVASLLKRPDGHDVIATEGGHIDWAPLDPLEDRILEHLRENFRRVSVERLVSGGGLLNIYEALGTIEKRPFTLDDKDLWTAALSGSDTLAQRRSTTSASSSGRPPAISRSPRVRRPWSWPEGSACGWSITCRVRVSATALSPRAASSG